MYFRKGGENGPVSFAKSVRITGFDVETTAVGIK